MSHNGKTFFWGKVNESITAEPISVVLSTNATSELRKLAEEGRRSWARRTPSRRRINTLGGFYVQERSQEFIDKINEISAKEYNLAKADMKKDRDLNIGKKTVKWYEGRKDKLDRIGQLRRKYEKV